MKIPSSSSLILATLAISSSSASLAAPTGDGAAEGSLSQIRGQAEPLQHANQAMENEGADGGLTERDLGEIDPRGMIETTNALVGIPIVGPMLAELFKQQCPNPNDPSSQALDAPDPAEVQRIQDAAAIMSSALAGVIPTGSLIPELPLPTGALSGSPANLVPLSNDDNGGDPNAPGASPSGGPSDATATPAAVAAVAATGDGDGSFLISPTTTVANAEEAGPTPSQDPAYLSGAADSGAPTSPGVPAGPPNTPVPAATGV